MMTGFDQLMALFPYFLLAFCLFVCFGSVCGSLYVQDFNHFCSALVLKK